MKKVYLMKGMAAMAFGLVVASCNKFDAFNPYAEQEAKQQEFTQNFQTSVMGGQTIDQNQTWANTTATQVSVTSEVAGTLKIYTANPIGEVAAALYTQDITAGTINVTVAKPADVETLYAALINKDGSLRVTEVSNGSVKFTAPGSIPASAPRRAQAYGVTFPDAPAAADYKTTYPEGTQHFNNYAAGGSWYADESNSGARIELNPAWDGSKNVNGGPLYLVSNGGDGVIAPSYFYIDARNEGGAYLYICPGVTLKLNTQDSGNLQAGLKVYIAEGATLETEAELKLNSVTIYNNGTIKAPSLTGNGTGILYNQGNVDVDGYLAVTNSTTFIVNEGTITAASYGSEGSGSFWNLGTVTISGTTTVNSNSNGWINEGQYTTKDFIYNAGSINVWNKCKLTVTNLFNMTLGDSSTSTFALDSKSSMVTKDFLIAGPARINMGEESIIKVTGTATMDCRKADYGIYGPTSGDKWAVFQAPSIVKGIDNQGYEVTYGGNLYVACDSHFANGMSGGYPYIDFKGNAELRDGQAAAPITIEKNGNCSDGYKGGDTPDPDPVQWYYYAFEDLGTTDDFDFNDVVIRVSAPVDNVSTVQLVAAGGTLSTTVLYNDQAFNATEVHQLFGAASTSEMVNTGKGPEKKFVTLGTITVAAGTNMANLPFGISAQGTNGQLTKVTQSVENIGKAPLVIVVAGYPSGDNAGRWFWPTERTMISDAYTDFGNWGANASSYKNWYIPKYASDKFYQWNSSKEQ
jgi:hypothetical protein